MGMKASDNLIAPSRGTPEQAIAYAARRFAPNGSKIVVDYLTEVFRYAPIINVDPSVVVSQSHLETNGWRDDRFQKNGNPAGLLISQSGDPDPATWNGTEAARVHLYALAHACNPNVIPDWGFLPHSARAFVERWTAKYNDPNCPKVVTIDDLNIRYRDARGEMQATWAWDDKYQDKIVERARAIFGDALPDQTEDTPPMPNLDMTPGLIPLPSMLSSIVDVSKRCQGDGRGFDNLGPRTIKGVVLHRSQGTWDGNQSHFHSHCPGALTDIQVHHIDGRMMRFVRVPGDSPSGWANGRVKGAYGDGKAFVDRYGINAVNRDLESCEITGFFAQPGETTREDPVGDPCWESLAQWVASRAHDYGITYETFPLIPGEGNRSFCIWHQEFTIGTGKVCPGKTVMDGTTAMLDRARAIMLEAQTGAGPIEPPIWPKDPMPAPDGFLAQGHPLTVLADRRLKATQGGRFKTAPSRDAPDVAKPPYKAGRSYVFDFSATVDGEEWLVSKRGSWAAAQNFTNAA